MVKKSINTNSQAEKRKAIILLGACFVLIAIFIISFLTSVQQNNLHNQNNNIPTPIPQALQPKATGTSLLSMQKQSDNSVAVMINTQGKKVSAVQIEISFDPKVLTNVTVSQGNFFDNQLILSNTIDPSAGKIFYAVAIDPFTGKQKSGQGTVATITYDVVPGITNQTTLMFLNRTKVTAEGIDESVLKTAQNLTIPVQ